MRIMDTIWIQKRTALAICSRYLGKAMGMGFKHRLPIGCGLESLALRSSWTVGLGGGAARWSSNIYLRRTSVELELRDADFLQYLACNNGHHRMDTAYSAITNHEDEANFEETVRCRLCRFVEC